jgi:hypothetical protein
VKGNAAVASAAVPHAGGLHGVVEAFAELGGVVGVAGVGVAEDELVVGLVRGASEVALELGCGAVGERHGAA